MAAFVSGLLTGLGVAVPVGAIGVLLLGEGMRRGFRRSWPAGVAVGLVDTTCAAVALLAGAAASGVIAGWGRWPWVVGGIVLVGLAVRGLLHPVRAPGGATSPTPTGPGLIAAYAALAAVNPATLLYFAALTLGLAGRLTGTGAAVAFVAGVGIASTAWQLVLLGAGSLVRVRLGERGRTATAVAGNLVVAGFGAVLLFGGLA